MAIKITSFTCGSPDMACDWYFVTFVFENGSKEDVFGFQMRPTTGLLELLPFEIHFW